MNQVYLMIGSNIDPALNIPLSLENLLRIPEIRVLARSSVWKTRPIGTRAADFFNIAVHLSTCLEEIDLKAKVLFEIEKKMGRIRVEDKFAPRPIDLDIVIFNDKILDENLFRHDYMILPFSEIIPNLMAPEQGLPLKVLATTIKPFSTAKIMQIELPPLNLTSLKDHRSHS